MGGDLTAQKSKAPKFIVWAVKDPDDANLDRIQIVKGWTKHGQIFEKVFDVAWSGNRKPDRVTGKVPAVGSTVNIPKATYTDSIGATKLENVWTDPEFDASQHAFYYARVLQIPTPRWTTYDAMKAGQTPPAGIAATVQERAWTSPIWYNPAEEVRRGQNPGTTVADLKAKGAVALDDAALKSLFVGKTHTVRDTASGQEFDILFGTTGRRLITKANGKQPEPGDVFDILGSSEAGSPAQYEIKDGHIITTLGTTPFEITVYKVGDKYVAARSNEFGFANYEMVATR